MNSLIRAFFDIALKRGNENRIFIGTFNIYDHIESGKSTRGRFAKWNILYMQST